jgi:hypothetical protein
MHIGKVKVGETYVPVMKIGRDLAVTITLKMIAITPVMAVEDHFIKIALNA